jgi:hypothetical protein
MTNTRVSVVEKVRFGVLFLPVLWLLSSVWVVINDASQRFTYNQLDEIKTPPSILEMLSLIILSLAALWTIGKIIITLRQHRAVSSELKSGSAFFLGLAIMTASSYLHLGSFLSYVGMVCIDIAAIIMIVTLIQGKPFGEMKLYYKDIEVRKVES